MAFKELSEILLEWIGVYIHNRKIRMSSVYKIIDVIKYAIIILYIALLYHYFGIITLCVSIIMLYSLKYFYYDYPNQIPIMFKTPKETESLRVVCISDTHNLAKEVKLPKGDILLHCGDFTKFGHESELRAFNSWFKKQNFKYRILIPGNHDYCVCPDKNPENYMKSRKLLNGATHVLYDEMVEIEGYKFYGTSYVPSFHKMAFNRTVEELEEIRSKVPDGVDILMSHSPPYGVRDQTWSGLNVGDPALLKAIKRIKPMYSLFGHIHEQRGVSVLDGTTFINCAICTLRYHAGYEPIVFDLPKRTETKTTQ